MSIKLTILEQMEQVAREHGKILAPLKEDLVLADCGLVPCWLRALRTRWVSTYSRPPRTRSFQ
jgi:hypothetical protein